MNMNISGINILYYAAAATTAIAGILHLSLVPNVIGRNPNSGIFFIISRDSPNFLGHTYAKKMGENMVFLRNRRHHNIDNNVGYHKSARKSYHR